MDIKPIKNNQELQNALNRIDQIIDAERGTGEWDELELLTIHIEAYEQQHFSIDPPSLAEAANFRTEQQSV